MQDEELCGACGATALSGSLQLILDVPQAQVLAHINADLCHRLSAIGQMEALAQEQACAVQSLEKQFTSLASETPPPPPSPNRDRTPQLPSFGLGLKRQKSMVPVSFLTDMEAADADVSLQRCAAALSRLVRSSRPQI
jgi:hypothetical protein